MAAFFACIAILHLIIGLFFIRLLKSSVMEANYLPAFIGWFFVVFASIFIVLG